MIAGAKRVGKKRSISNDKPTTLKERFAANLRKLAGERSASSIAESIGVTPDTVLKWLRGDRTPDLDTWPELAKALGVKDWRNILPPG